MTTPTLDPIDKSLLRLLQRDATLTNKELAYKLDKSTATIHERVKRLKEQGFITKIVALVDRKKIDKTLIAIAHVLVKEHTAKTLAEFERSVVRFDEVMECYQMTGSTDFILKVAATDMEEYHLFLRHKLATLPNVVTVNSSFILSETKRETAYPL